jgi:hypothetical protein
MPANTAPIFTLTPEIMWTANMTVANTGNLSAGTSYIVFSAGTNGSYVQKIRFRHQSTNTNNAATMARVFINNGGALGTAAKATPSFTQKLFSNENTATAAPAGGVTATAVLAGRDTVCEVDVRGGQRAEILPCPSVLKFSKAILKSFYNAYIIH